MPPRFVQIHTLTLYPASLLNRDDVGFAKRIPFGGAVRTRISSQCLKRHWRTFDGAGSISQLDVPLSIRSRLTFDRHIVQPLVHAGASEALARAVTEAIMVLLLGQSAKAKKARAESDDGKEKKGKKKASDTAEGGDSIVKEEPLQTGQITVLGRPEIEFLLAVAKKVCESNPEPSKAADAVNKTFDKEAQKNLGALRLGAGLDAALFGRMVTSDILARCDAAIHVAHSFTVHAEAAETDYFSAVDDLLRTGDDAQLGSGHIGTTELTTGLFYSYVVVDIPLLVSNTMGITQKEWENADRELAAKVVAAFVNLMATVSPGAKLGSTAPHAYAHLVLTETGNAQPRTLANAFLDPVRARTSLIADAYGALVKHVVDLDGTYGTSWERRFAALNPRDALFAADGAEKVGFAEANRLDLSALGQWIHQQVRS